MFKNCPKLKEINLSNFNTSNVNDMSFMFSECTSLEELNISNFNINNVTILKQEINRFNNILIICVFLVYKINL